VCMCVCVSVCACMCVCVYACAYDMYLITESWDSLLSASILLPPDSWSASSEVRTAHTSRRGARVLLGHTQRPHIVHTQQSNGTDCGLCLLHFVEHFLVKGPCSQYFYDFSQVMTLHCTLELPPEFIMRSPILLFMTTHAPDPTDNSVS
jgi:hypothetical protein